MNIQKFNEFNFKIPSEVEELSDIFKKNGKKLYVVGGYVRDILMDSDPLDIDLATDSLPDETLKFLNRKYNVDLVGKAFGVIIVHLGDMKIEIASFRKDVSQGRHPEIKLGVSIEDDVKRRDITISSLFYDIQSKKVVDLVGGTKDIKNQIIRMVGNPKDRLQEDQLRALRCIRFACRYNFKFDSKTAEDLKLYTDLSQISKERVWEEMYKSYKQCSDYSKYLKMLSEFDLFKQIFPKLNVNQDIKKAKHIETYLANLLIDNNPDVRLLNALVEIFKIPSKICRRALFLISLLDLNIDNIVEIYKKRISCEVDNELILDWYNINNINKKVFIKFIDYKPSVSAEDLMSKGFRNAELGKEIKRLEILKFQDLIKENL